MEKTMHLAGGDALLVDEVLQEQLERLAWTAIRTVYLNAASVGLQRVEHIVAWLLKVHPDDALISP